MIGHKFIWGLALTHCWGKLGAYKAPIIKIQAVSSPGIFFLHKVRHTLFSQHVPLFDWSTICFIFVSLGSAEVICEGITWAKRLHFCSRWFRRGRSVKERAWIVHPG